jgi:hypothetical protein
LWSNDEKNGNDQMINPIKSEKKMITTAKDASQMIRARTFLNRLDKKVQEKDDIVKQIR